MIITTDQRRLICNALADHAATLMQISYQWKIVKTGRGNDLQEQAANCLHIATELEHSDIVEVIK